MKNTVRLVIIITLVLAGIFVMTACKSPAQDIPEPGIGDTQDEPFLVFDTETLKKVGTNEDGWGLDKFYKQTADIYLSEELDDWKPIGGTFSGSYDGNNFTIIGLCINGEPKKDHQGLFAQVSGTIKDLNLEDVLIVGRNNVGSFAGTLSGEALIENCSAEGIVEGANYAGGLAGRIEQGTIVDCRFLVDVSGSSYVGGLAGSISKGIIDNCQIEADVLGSSSYTGGIAGQVSGTGTITIKGCTLKGDIDGNSWTGGIVGQFNKGTNGSKIEYCNMTGNVTGSSTQTGGIAGSFSGGSIKNCTVTANVMGSNYHVGGIAGDTSSGDVVDTCTFTGTVKGGFNHVGGISGYSFGIITNSTSSGTVEGAGESIGGIAGISYSNILNCHSECDITVTLPASVNHGINVGGVAGEILSNSNVKNCYSTGDISGVDYVGGVVGYVSGKGIVENCYSTGDIFCHGTDSHGNGSIGGVAGHVTSEGQLIKSHSEGSVSGKNTVGGVAGYNSGTIKYCYSQGAVNGNINNSTNGDGSAGGVVGTNVQYAEVLNCYAVGNISGNAHNMGGVAGYNVGTVLNCFSTGNVENSSTRNDNQIGTGGLVGYNNGGEIKNGYAKGNISAINYVGGTTGQNSQGRVENCVSLNINVKATSSTTYANRIMGRNSMGIPVNNYARDDMTITIAGSTTTPESDDPASDDGKDAAANDYLDNSANWWKDTVLFPDTEWEFKANQLPALIHTGGD